MRLTRWEPIMTEGTAKRKTGDTLRRGKPRKPSTAPPNLAKSRSKPRSKAAGGAAPGARKNPPVKLLSGGNPQIAKADGDVPVRAYLAAIPGWKRGVAECIDGLVTRNVPGVRKAVKWNSPFYGVEGRGWFLSFHVFTRYVKATFFRGTSLRPVPPGGTGKEARWIDVHEGDLDEAQLATWIRQAASIPGWSGR